MSKQRYIRTIYDDNEKDKTIAIIDKLESPLYTEVVLLDEEKPYKNKFFIELSDDRFIEHAKLMRKLGI